MKIMHCPLNGPRNIAEFACFGEVVDMPDPGACSDADWANHIWLSDNAAGVVREWWCHVPTSFWFIAERDMLSDEIVRTYAAGELFGKRMDFKPPQEGA